MKKKSFGAKPLIAPAPVLVIGSYDKAGKPNIMTAAWGGICSSDPPSIAVAIREGRRSYENILAQKAFTVNIPQTTQAAAADYAGLYSGKSEDKFAALGLTPRCAEAAHAPVIEEFPFNLVCTLSQVIPVGAHSQFIGEIKEVLIAETALDESGQFDAALLQPLLFVPGKRGYYGIGEWVAQAFSVGKKPASTA